MPASVLSTMGIFSISQPIKSLIGGTTLSTKGRIISVSIVRPRTPKAEPISSYFMLSISFIVSAVLSNSPSILLKALTPSACKSSHIVPKSWTPRAFLSVSSSSSKRAFITSCVASFALSPPSLNADISSEMVYFVSPPVFCISFKPFSFSDNPFFRSDNSLSQSAILSAIFIFFNSSVFSLKFPCSM